MNRERIKVVWLCHFANTFLNEYFGITLKELSRWMDSFMNIVHNRSDIVVHVVAPNYWTNEDCTIERDNIVYHLYRFRLLRMPRLGVLEQLFTREWYVKKKIKRIVDSINPDVIHLFGSENMDYSCGVLNYIHNENVVITIQGFVNDTPDRQRFPRSMVLNYRKRLESIINSTMTKFTMGYNRVAKERFQRHYPNVKTIYTLKFPTTIPCYRSGIDKKYDIVFWGRVCREKGFIDLLDALHLLKKKGLSCSLLVIGKLENASSDEIVRKVHEYDMSESICFAGFFASLDEMFIRAQEGCIYVLPTHYDGMPGSVREAMHLKIPVITTPVGALSQININKRCARTVC